MPAHEAAEGFPFEMAGLDAYDAIILSDIGANTLLLPPDVWLQSKTVPNRLKLIRDWVEQGGGLLMAGGYFSFQGIDGKARWRRTAVEDTLPVTCLPWDDRVEMPEGTTAELVVPEHPILAGPRRRLAAAPRRQRGRAQEGRHPPRRACPTTRAATRCSPSGHHGKGRTAAWTSDIGPHWLSPAFCEWPVYRRLWKNLFDWLTGAE